MSRGNILATRRGRLAAFGLLYITEGIPIGFTATAMAAYMRAEGVGAAQIGAFVGTLYLPWAFKWAWAPLVDLVPLVRFGGKRAWIMGCQSIMVLTLLSFAFVDLAGPLPILILLIFVHNLFGSMQDVAIDALACQSLAPNERGTANGLMFGGAYFGQTLGGAGALFLSGQFGFNSTFPYIAAMILAVMLLVSRRLHDPLCDSLADAGDAVAHPLNKFRTQLLRVATELYAGFFRSGRGPLVGVALALLPAGALALTVVTNTTFQVDLGMTQAEIAEISMYSTIIAALACVVGGWLSDRFGHRRSLALWYACSAVPGFYMAWLLRGQAGVGEVTIAQYYPIVLSAYLFTGLHYGVGSAVFMGITNPVVAATQFTGFMALKNVAIAYTNFWQGAAIEKIGFSTVFFIDGCIVLLPLLLLPFLRARVVPQGL